MQRENREDTIINQDGTFLLEAIRNGLKGASDLSNYVDSVLIRRLDGTRRTFSKLTSPEVIGLLTTPKYNASSRRPESNTVSAVIRAISGSAVDKPPAIPGDRDFVFRYLLTSEVIPATPTPTNGLSGADLQQRLALSDNLHELRLTFRWPVLPAKPGDTSTRTGRNRRTFSTLVSGQIEARTNESVGYYYFQPSVFQ